MKYTLTPGWTVAQTATRIVLSSEETELRIRLDKNATAVMRKLVEGWAPNEVLELEPLRAELARRGILRPRAIAPVPEQERQIEYWRAFTDDAVGAVSNVCSSTVAIVGVGGIGAVVLQHLVGAGVRQFRLLDADDVELSNLNRQFIYGQSSVGRQKVDAARAYVIDRVPAAKVSVLAASWDPNSSQQRSFVSQGVDFVVAAIDKPTIEAAIAILQVSWSAQVPSILATVGLHRSLVSPVFSPELSPKAPRDVFPTAQFRNSGQPFQASHGPTNTFPAAIAADQILHHLAGLDHFVEYEKALIIRRAPDGAPRATRVDTVQL